MTARTEDEERLVRGLSEAYTTELVSAAALAERAAQAPPGGHRAELELHLDQTTEHVGRLRMRLELFDKSGLRQRLAAGLHTRANAVARLPGELAGEQTKPEAVLRGAMEQCATEAREIATYEALERLADKAGDNATAELCLELRTDHEQALIHLHERLPDLTDAVIGVSMEPKPILARLGVATVFRAARQGTQLAGRLTGGVSSIVGGLAPTRAKQSQPRLAIDDYDSLSAKTVIARLSVLSAAELETIESYERRGKNRSTVLARISSLRAHDPARGSLSQGA